jgi:HAD superfamily hydrolase (TIGR01509 family)
VALRAIIFDCDGVLVVSEALAWRAWREVLDDYGYEPSSEDVQLLLGRTAEEILDYFSTLLNIADGSATLARLNLLLAELFEQHLVAYQDGAALVASAHAKGLQLAVASSSGRERVIRALELTHLRHYFEVIVTGDDVARGKPAPDVYAEAARRLGVPCHECLAVEDSPHGVTSALAAGMPVVAVLSAHTPPERVALASVVVDKLSVSILDGDWPE